MQKTSPAQSQFGHVPVKKMLVAMSMACVLSAGSVHAQVVVTDPVNTSANESGFTSQLAKTIEQFKKQIEQYAKQVEQYGLQLQQYKQMLSGIQNLSNGVSLTPNPLQHITNTQALIEGKCSSSSGSGGGVRSMVSSLMNSMASLMSKPITQSQQEICAHIVTTQIEKYNSTVDMLNNMTEYGNQFKQLDNLLQGNPTQADADRASAQVEKYHSAVTTQMSDWEAGMKADDAIISTLQSQQSSLGRAAFNGKPTPLGTVIQAATFARAFQ